MAKSDFVEIPSPTAAASPFPLHVQSCLPSKWKIKTRNAITAQLKEKMIDFRKKCKIEDIRHEKSQER